MEGDMTTPLAQAVALIKEGNIAHARAILIEILKQNLRDENAWLCMTFCVLEGEQKRYCFERVLKLNPQNQHAIAGLRRLNNSGSPPPPLEADQQPTKPQVLRFLIQILGMVVAGLVLVLICVYVLLFVPPGP
jgi:hypothetical protein